jgi:hypothetical protein
MRVLAVGCPLPCSPVIKLSPPAPELLPTMRTAASALAKLEVGGWGSAQGLCLCCMFLQPPPDPCPEPLIPRLRLPAGGSRNDVLEGLHDGSASPSSTSSASSLRDGYASL